MDFVILFESLRMQQLHWISKIQFNINKTLIKTDLNQCQLKIVNAGCLDEYQENTCIHF